MKTHVALITGAARRIGAAIARDLSSKKWRVIVHYHQSEAEALSLSDEIRNRGGLCETIRADLRDRDDIENLVPRCVERFGTIDCLINNAAFFSYDNIETLEWDLWNRHIATNL
ncbi:MAG TPA: SDR family NAD(P)-dependent oxidoreductase, partial [Stellaceae bacterium]|nr:SDR family NAD(P)-dependent oxidoreductase [Stellaceae bacterium]